MSIRDVFYDGNPGPLFYAYMAGQHLANRNRWLCDARSTQHPDNRRMCVEHARFDHHGFMHFAKRVREAS